MSVPPRAAQLIEQLELRPHPEGGYYRELLRSKALVMPADGRDVRSAATTIYFLLTAERPSRLHQVRSDEVWHFYEGDPLELIWLDRAEFDCHRVTLGPVAEGRRPVAVVPAGSWQAARSSGAYTLAGCTVCPGFEFEDFRLLAEVPDEAGRLLKRHPDLRVFV